MHMLRLQTGVDLIEIARVERAVARHGMRFTDRVFTGAEQALCQGRTESLAGRFAAKEAVAKALGTGIWREGIGWTDIEILRAESGAPQLCLHGAAARRAADWGLTTWSLSLSHDRHYAIAFTVATGTTPAAS